MNRSFTIFGKLLKVQTINYFTDPVNIILGFILTAFTMVSWIAFKVDPGSHTFATDPFILASAIGISAIRNSQYNFNLTIGDWREKKLFQRLSYTPISRRLLVTSILIFNWFINILVTLFLFGLAMIFKSQRTILGDVSWGPFVVGYILNVLLSNVLAFLLVTIIKRKDLMLTISLFSYFGPMYLLGLGIPWTTVGNVKILNEILYIMPHRYPLSIMQAAWTGHAYDMAFVLQADQAPLDWVGSWLNVHGFGYGGQSWWLPAVATLGWTALFASMTGIVIAKSINIGQKKYKQYTGIQKHFHYINEIKRAKSIEQLNELVDFINAKSVNKIRKKTDRTKNRTIHKFQKKHVVKESE